MAVDVRDQIWKVAYLTWYDSAYNLELASRMVDRLKAIDDITKTLVALTASGSAVAGWQVWKNGGFDAAWALLAGLAAVLSICHGSLSISGRLKEWLETKRDFTSIEVDLKSFRYSMEIDPNFDVPKFQGKLDEFRTRFGEAVSRIPSDFFATSRLKLRCQVNLNARISGRKEAGDGETNDG